MPTDQDLLTVRPRLRNDAVFLRVDTGLYLRHSESACVLKGGLAYQWMSILGPRMNGETSVAELCAGLSDSQRQTVLSLTRALLDRGFVRHVPEPVDAGLPVRVLHRFRSQINLIEHLAGPGGEPPATRFARFRSARVLVVGESTTLVAAMQGLVRNGLARVSYVLPADGTDVGAALAADVDALRADEVPVTLSALPAVPENVWDEYQTVVFASGGGDLADLLALTLRLRMPRPSGDTLPRLLPVVSSGGRVVLGPVTGASAAPCWVCAQLRLAATGDPGDAADLWRALALRTGVERPGTAGVTVPRMIGNAAALEVFRLMSGLGTDLGGGHVVVQDAETLNAVREPLLPHPACPVCRDTPSAPDARTPPPESGDVTEEQFYELAGRLVSRLAGPLTGWSDEPLDQIPLKIGRVRVTGSGALTGGTRVVSAFHTETILSARVAAMKVALTWYAGTCVWRPDAEPGPDRGPAASGRTVVAGPDLCLWSGLGGEDRTHPWIPAQPLAGGDPVLVPQAAAYPFSSLNDDLRFDRAPAGAAAGSSPDEIVATGLPAALGHRALTRAVRGEPVVPVPDDVLAGDVEARFLLRGMAHLGHNVRVYALPAAHPAHAVLVLVDDSPLWTLGAALSARDALHAALRDALGLLQVRHYESVDADLGDPPLADFDPATRLAVSADAGWSIDAEPLDVPAALTALAAAGLAAYLVDTTPADLRALGGVHTGTVLLAASSSAPR